MNYLLLLSVSKAKNLIFKSHMKTNEREEMKEKVTPLLEQKKYKRMVNEIVPIQQAETYRNPTQKVIKEAVNELNPDVESMESRG